MQVKSIRSLAASEAKVAIVGVHPGRKPAVGASGLLKGRTAWIKHQLDTVGFGGALGDVTVLTLPDAPVERVVFVGIGENPDHETLRQAAARGRKQTGGADVVVTSLHRVLDPGGVGAVLDGLALAEYRFESYKSKSEDREELTVELLSPASGWESEAERSSIVTDAVCLARDLVNEPPAGKAPLAFADRVSQLAIEAGLEAETWEGERLVEERMGGIIGVGQGSHRPPALLILRHRPRRPRGHLALVGKGIVFDSGGLSLKPPRMMETMKSDMAGAAAVVAAAIALGRLGGRYSVTAYAAMAENLPGGGAQRPSDVLTARNGKTIEVLNTDAEGRLVLADALSLAAEQEPDLIVDLATLTGACKVALGPKIAGVFGKQREHVERVTAAADAAGERTWPLPLPSDYRSFIDSAVADMKNTGAAYGGAISAAMLLAEFVGDVAWAHMDIAGPAFVDTAEHYIPKGGTGFGVRTLIELAEAMG